MLHEAVLSLGPQSSSLQRAQLSLFAVQRYSNADKRCMRQHSTLAAPLQWQLLQHGRGHVPAAMTQA